MNVERQRSYHDLSPEEKARYDRLRGLAKRLGNDPGGVRAKRCGSRRKRARRLYEAADAMLGLRIVEGSKTEQEHDPSYRVWRGSATHYVPRNGGGSACG
jgi:hypothetical protein